MTAIIHNRAHTGNDGSARLRPPPAKAANHRQRRKSTNKPLNEWGNVLHDEDMAAAILDRVLERGRFIHLDGPRGELVISTWKRPYFQKRNGSEFPERHSW